MIDLQFSGSHIPDDLSRFGIVFDAHPPRVKLKAQRNQIPKILSALLSQYDIEDVSVQDRPLEEVIAEMFTFVKQNSTDDWDEEPQSPSTVSTDSSVSATQNVPPDNDIATARGETVDDGRDGSALSTVGNRPLVSTAVSRKRDGRDGRDGRKRKQSDPGHADHDANYERLERLAIQEESAR